MKIKTLILTICFLLTFTGVKIPASSYATVKDAVMRHMVTEENTYVRVLIEGIWYIYVYGPDGSLIIVYPDLEE
jgi:hypothetical protein